MEPSVEFDARVVEDVLAFIDAFHASSSDEHSRNCSAKEAATARELGGSLMGLRVALRDLCDKLIATRDWIDASRDMSLLEQLECVAVGETGLDGIQHGLQLCHYAWEQLHQSRLKVRFTPLQDPNVTSVLRRRLDELITHATSGAGDRPLLQRKRVVDKVEDRDISPWNRGVMMRFRSGRFIPFKLSILTRAAWNVVAGSTFARSGQSQSADFEHQQEVVGSLHFDDDGSEVVTVLRRVEVADGSVLICWASIQSPGHKDCDPSTSAYRRSESHDVGWVRVGRLITDGVSQPRAFIETVCDVAIQPVSDDDALDINRFERFRSSMYDQVDRQGMTNQQRLENLMLEMTISSPRSPQIISR